MNVDGGSLSNLTNNSASDSYPGWSSDSSKIAFQTDRDGNSEVYVMDANGSGQANLTNDAADDGAPPGRRSHPPSPSTPTATATRKSMS